MTLFLALMGCLGAVLFSLAGYRTIINMRQREQRGRISYQGRVEAIYEAPRGNLVMSAATMLKRAIVAKSIHVAKD